MGYGLLALTKYNKVAIIKQYCGVFFTFASSKEHLNYIHLYAAAIGFVQIILLNHSPLHKTSCYGV